MNRKLQQFRLTENHLKLLRGANVGWQNDEFGAPCIDPKMPYGDSDVLKSVSKILGVECKRCPKCGEVLDPRDDTVLDTLHNETWTALQIVLCTQSFRPGLYIQREEYVYDSWTWEDEL